MLMGFYVCCLTSVCLSVTIPVKQVNYLCAKEQPYQ